MASNDSAPAGSIPHSRVGTTSTIEKRVKLLGSVPESYMRNTDKEELCLEYLEDFRRRFVELFPERRALFLAPKNECGVSKFV